METPGEILCVLTFSKPWVRDLVEKLVKWSHCHYGVWKFARLCRVDLGGDCRDAHPTSLR